MTKVSKKQKDVPAIKRQIKMLIQKSMENQSTFKAEVPLESLVPVSPKQPQTILYEFEGLAKSKQTREDAMQQSMLNVLSSANVVGFNVKSKRFNEAMKDLPGPGSYLDPGCLSSFKKVPMLTANRTEESQAQNLQDENQIEMGPGPGQYPVTDPWTNERDRAVLL